MRHFRRLMILILCAMMLTTVVHASSTVETVNNYSTISADGSVDVTLSVTVYLDTPASGLKFPLPAGAKDVTFNGGSVRLSQTDTAVLADLSAIDGLSGQYTMSFHYRLANVLETVEVEVKDKDGDKIERRLLLTLPLLSGFDYPVEYLDFSVTFPGELTMEPNFSSGYLGNSVESLLDWNISGYMVTGNTTAALQDKESLVLTMNVSEEMFPGKLLLPREGDPETMYMGICAALAVVYWLLMMRCIPIFRQSRTTPPEGVTAGEIGSRLSAAGVDLTMMVFSWAQMGYLRIRPDKYDRVWLDKQMDMGNERTEFEVRLFRTLFARKKSIDGTGSSYARLCRKAAATVSGAHEMYRRKAGNIQIFRVLFCGVSLFCGVCYGMHLSYDPSTRVVLAILFAIVGVITGWAIQNGMFRFHIRGKTQQYIAAVCMVIWIVLGIVADVAWLGVLAVLAQMVAGLAAAYGGRRSSLGRLHAGQILGLRHYLKHVTREELEQLMENNPDYLFDMLPYAIALGVDSRFARQFGDLKIPQCAYLTAREDRARSAQEWAYLLRKTADKLDKRQRQMQVQQWTLVSLRRPASARRTPGRPAPQSRSSRNRNTRNRNVRSSGNRRRR